MSNRKNNKTIIITILCIIGIISIIGYTYSFFAAEVSNAVTIKGDAASPTVGLTISRVAPSEDKKLIPQLDDVIHKAVIGTQGNCLDDNNNAVCQVYKITVTNTSTVATYINGKIELDAKDNPNLKWAQVSGLSNTTLVSDIKTHEDTILTSSELYEGGEVKDYYVVVWISEIGIAQTDSGSFTGTVTFENIASNPALATLTRLGITPENEILTTFTTTSKLDGTTGVYASDDDLGTSYYFRGNITNNYVYFAGFYWRIIRINGDGSIRMIYDGTIAHSNSEVTTDKQMGTSPYNVNSGDNAFVGYMNGTVDGTNFPSGGTNSTTYAEAHTNTTNSTIKTYIDNWYKTNIVDKGYSSYVADAIYCNDRTVTMDETKNEAFGVTGQGYGTYGTFYNPFGKFEIDFTEGSFKSVTPTLTCTQENDKFTVSETKGNGTLTYPIGLITSDEIIMAGGYLYTDNTMGNEESYLNNGDNYYWTMSPVGFADGENSLFQGRIGSLDLISSSSNNGVRPVISVNATAITEGNGIISNPFIVSESPVSPALATLTRLGITPESEILTTFTTTSKLDGTTGVYASDDDLGVSYYFRGNVTNNYVYFAGFYWRIVRINGDGSIRMIYDGTSAHSNSEVTTDKQIGTSPYNVNGSDNAFVGYMNGTTDGTNFPSGGTNSTSYIEAHTNTTNSTIKTYIDNWYKTNIVDKGYSSYVADAIYCNDRTIPQNENINNFWGENGEGFGTSATLYSFYGKTKFISSSQTESVTPTLKCTQTNDRFTKNMILSGVDGNGKLTYPIGLINVDEVVFAGGYWNLGDETVNNELYLYNGNYYYFTMSSAGYFDYARMLEVNNGKIDGATVSSSAVRPVISINASSITGGSGSSTDPFTIPS